MEYVVVYFDGVSLKDVEFYDPMPSSQYDKEKENGDWQHSRYLVKYFGTLEEATKWKKQMEDAVNYDIENGVISYW